MTDNPGNLPLSGVHLVAENFEPFRKMMATATKMIEEQGKKAEEAAKRSQKYTDATGKFEKGISNLLQRFTQGNPAVQKATALLGDFGIQLSGATLKATLAIGVVAALTAAFIALGQRGSALTGLGESFDRLTASIGITSTALLSDLREASVGTVADFELIRQANFALAGATGEFGKQFGQNLPKLLELARVQARATGQSVDFLFQSLIMGIKRGSPLLIDNTGLVLKVGEANEEYAEKVGKTVEQLTQEETQIALLNATLAAGELAITALGDAQETAADKIARGQATITNILDTLALSVQPAFSAILDAGNAILAQIDQLAKALGPVITEITNFIGGTIANVVNLLSVLLQPIVDLIAGFAPYVTLALRTINTVIIGVQKIILGVAGQIFGFVGDLKTLPKSLFEGAAAAFGAFANGILAAANTVIFPAIIGIARFIADFLIGLSPPPKGPLSKIDQGGTNMMLAWLEGISGVSLEPVAQVADEVNALLGSIGQFSLKQVNARLAQLDAALLPFQNRLDIVKSTFEAIADPAKAALDAIDRQIAGSIEALSQGDQAAAALIRNLDAQSTSIQAVLNDQQRLVDNAQIQFALAKAQQAQERTLLTIQKARLGVEEKTARKRKESGGISVPKEKKLTGAAPEITAAGVTLEPGAAAPGVLSDLTGQGNVDAALEGLQFAFGSQLTQLGAFEENRQELSGILGEIGGIDLGAKIQGKFDGIKEGLETALENARIAVETKIGEIGAFFTNAETPGTLPYFFQTTLPTELNNARTGIETAINNALAAFNPDVPGTPAAQVRAFVDGLINPEVEGSIPFRFGRLGVEIINKAVQVRTDIESAISNIFDPERETSISYKALDFVDSIINPEREGSIPAFFASLPGHISTAVTGIGEVIQTSIIDPIATFFTGSGPGTIGGLITDAVNFFAAFPGRVVTVLQGLGLTVFNVIVKPIELVINSLIELVETALKGLLQSIIDILAPQAGTVLDVGGVLSQAIESLRGAQAAINFGRVNIAPPEFLTSPPPVPVNSVTNTVNNTFNITAPGAAEFAMRNAAFSNAGRG